MTLLPLLLNWWLPLCVWAFCCLGLYYSCSVDQEGPHQDFMGSVAWFGAILGVFWTIGGVLLVWELPVLGLTLGATLGLGAFLHHQSSSYVQSWHHALCFIIGYYTLCILVAFGLLFVGSASGLFPDNVAPGLAGVILLVFAWFSPLMAILVIAIWRRVLAGHQLFKSSD